MSLITNAARKILNEPDPVFQVLAGLGRKARVRGYYTRAEFLLVCYWKSRRHIGRCASNTEREVRVATSKAFAVDTERGRIEALLALNGVAVPTASALLAAANPKAFGVIDIRAWQFLYSAGMVNRNKAGRSLSINNWLEYLPILRSVSKTVGTSARLVEIALYKAHKKRSKEPLYSGSRASNTASQRTAVSGRR